MQYRSGRWWFSRKQHRRAEARGIAQSISECNVRIRATAILNSYSAIAGVEHAIGVGPQGHITTLRVVMQDKKAITPSKLTGKPATDYCRSESFF